MVSILLVASLGGLAATATTAVATGDASALAHASHAVPPGLHMALSHVPSSSEAYEVLKQHLSLYTGTGSGGAAAGAVAHGLHLGLGK